MFWILLLYLICVFVFSWKNFRAGVGLLILLLPAYLIRIRIGPLPTTVLEMTLGAVCLVWLIKYFREDGGKIVVAVKERPWFFGLVGFFFVASLVGIFVSGVGAIKLNYGQNTYQAFGIWRAFFLEPMILFFILLGRVKSGALSVGDITKFLIWSGVSVALVAVSQKIFGWPYAPSLWNDEIGGRATSFFTSPNAVGLYLGPLFVLCLTRLLRWKYIPDLIWFVLFGLALLFSWSQGAWLALSGAVIIILYLLRKKRTAIVIALLGLALALYWVPVREAMTFADKASQNRLHLWNYSWQYLSQSPAHFIGGAGLRQFFWKVQYPFFQEDTHAMEILTYPHNFFLNFWSEIGLVGAGAFLGILGYLFYLSAQIYRRDKLLGAGMIGLLVVYFIHGLVDVPYFKNDLSIMFWLYVLVLFLQSHDHAGSDGART
ncbi:MAG: hypothetical protein A2261_01830 [Candidatus Magasanikbacteria bacterium RIFOXYA2_FULL_44_8]|uniref:O-antigen ligase-related domain-containing protein n=1 Tax=Candidatus Magasanikbacteria bacterium RIFOXYA2_FULL_44_8 TaxID=1798696 RepID=A0A1F6NLT7_9BACT|nr:MAG: hypothetical protein A2261_01830 [Candidatus Magasanikbacteria bacterium RIFOXYA2_FULL_44_8]